MQKLRYCLPFTQTQYEIIIDEFVVKNSRNISATEIIIDYRVILNSCI